MNKLIYTLILFLNLNTILSMQKPNLKERLLAKITSTKNEVKKCIKQFDDLNNKEHQEEAIAQLEMANKLYKKIIKYYSNLRALTNSENLKTKYDEKISEISNEKQLCFRKIRIYYVNKDILEQKVKLKEHFDSCQKLIAKSESCRSLITHKYFFLKMQCCLSLAYNYSIKSDFLSENDEERKAFYDKQQTYFKAAYEYHEKVMNIFQHSINKVLKQNDDQKSIKD